MNYILQKDFNWFGKIIPAGTRYWPHGADDYWPSMNGAHVCTMALDFYTVKNNPEYFKLETTIVYVVEQHDTFKGVADRMHYQFTVSRPLTDNEKQSVRAAIEGLLNPASVPLRDCAGLHISQIDGFKV